MGPPEELARHAARVVTDTSEQCSTFDDSNDAFCAKSENTHSKSAKNSSKLENTARLVHAARGDILDHRASASSKAVRMAVRQAVRHGAGPDPRVLYQVVVQGWQGCWPDWRAGHGPEGPEGPKGLTDPS